MIREPCTQTLPGCISSRRSVPGAARISPGPAALNRDELVHAVPDNLRHLGVSNVSVEQVAAAQSIAPVVAVQNFYNLAVRADDALVDQCAEQGIAFVPFFPARRVRPCSPAR